MNQAALMTDNTALPLPEGPCDGPACDDPETSGVIGHHYRFLLNLMSKGGPDPEDYYELDACMLELFDLIKTGEISGMELSGMYKILGESFPSETIQGFIHRKPHGYAGDFEIIDRIHTRYICPDPRLSKWDIYWQEQSAAKAVRKRICYFMKIIKGALTKRRDINVLNLASGPGRDMLLFYSVHPGANVSMDCVEQDENAVKHASELCSEYLDRITFITKNALRFRTFKKYDLIWSSGLFDYFRDNVFVFMIKKLKSMLADGGEIVIGNFSSVNPSRPHMELFDWNLYHRSPQKLRALALQSGVDEKSISIGREETGINLFLHIRN